jgi:hypothetical protein
MGKLDEALKKVLGLTKQKEELVKKGKDLNNAQQIISDLGNHVGNGIDKIVNPDDGLPEKLAKAKKNLEDFQAENPRRGRRKK